MDRQPNVNDLQRAVHELETALLKVEALYSGTAYEGSAMLNAARAVMGGCQRSSRRFSELVADAIAGYESDPCLSDEDKALERSGAYGRPGWEL